MQTAKKIKIGPFLVISSVLAVWMFLAAGSSEAHDKDAKIPSISCSTLPEDAFFSDTEIAAITSSALTSTVSTARGSGVSKRGAITHHYAKVTIPAVAAGELRVFDSGAAPTDAKLCRSRDKKEIAKSIKSYTVHNSAYTAADTATKNATKASDASTKASDAADAADKDTIKYKYTFWNTDLDPDAYETKEVTGVSDLDTNQDNNITSADLAADANAETRAKHQAGSAAFSTALSTARTALSTARSALSTARSNLTSARTALNKFSTASTEAEAALTAQLAANTAYNNASPVNTALADFTELSDISTKLTAAAAALNTSGTATTAAPALTAAATALKGVNAASGEHTPFKLRAAVMPGDEEYIVIVAPQNTGTPATASATTLSLKVEFHGAIATTRTESRSRLVRTNFAQDTITIKITAPGLLTVKTTGSTDTVGTLYAPDDNDANTDEERAHAESGGSGGNFEFVVPVTSADYTVVVEGQTRSTAGDYTLDMGFKVAMTAPTGFNITGITSVAGAAWAADATAFADDDTTVQIKRRAVDGNVADEDYFVFTVDNDSSGLLTVSANDDTGTDRDPDANTKGTLFGPMETGLMGEKWVGEITADADSGPGSHFGFTVPVEENRVYAVKVEGTDGYYTLQSELEQVTHPTTTDPTVQSPSVLAAAYTDSCPTDTNRAFEICPKSELEVDRYLLNLAESGTLVVESRAKRNTQPVDVVGALYGPDGTLITEDDNSGKGVNFRIAKKVAAGLYLLAVQGKDQRTRGVYELVINFVTGPAPEPPTEPTTPTDPDPDPDPEPTTDATGSLGNPPNRSIRSGIGIISGWVCQAETVTITITPVGSTTGSSFNIGYGGNRPDTIGQCEHNEADTGFAMAYNFNRLAEGEYEIEARADGERINRQTRRFTVVHLVPGEEFPRNLTGGARVLDFPTTGKTTVLEWETSSQGFVITDVQ